jgi:hypothetical protein
MEDYVMRHRWPAPIIGVILAGTLAIPALAARPDIHVEVIPYDYVQAECNGFDVVQYNVATLHLFTFQDKSGEINSEVTHADTVGVARRVYLDGTTVDVARYKDKGGIFVVRGDEAESCVGVDEAPHHPGARDAVDEDASARHPAQPDEFA